MACYSHGTLPPLSLKGARWTGVNGSDPTVGALSVLYLGRKRATDDENQLVQRKASGGDHSDVFFWAPRQEDLHASPSAQLASVGVLGGNDGFRTPTLRTPSPFFLASRNQSPHCTFHPRQQRAALCQTVWPCRKIEAFLALEICNFKVKTSSLPTFYLRNRVLFFLKPSGWKLS